MTEAVSDNAGKGRPRWARPLLALLIALFTLMHFYTLIEAGLPNLGLVPRAERHFDIQLKHDASLPNGWGIVTKVAPQTEAKFGIQPGDVLRFDRPLQFKQSHRVGDTMGFTVEHDGIKRHLILQYYVASDGGPDPGDLAVNILYLVKALTITALALVVLWKRWGNPAALCLGIILLDIGLGNDTIPRWSPSASFDTLYYFWANIGLLGIALLPALFYFLAEDARRRWQRALVIGWFVLAGVIVLRSLYIIATYDWSHPLMLRPAVMIDGSTVIGFLLGCTIAGASYSRLDAIQRNRIRFIVAAFALFVTAQIINTAQFLGYFPHSAGFFTFLTYVLMSITAAALLAYSMVRHRLFDFGFAVNRTLVFGSISFTLLATFGLMEWGAEHFVPEAWHEGGPFISAGVALGLFLVFHRLRDWIERHVERLFFSSWHRAEAALRRFVESAGHFDRMGVLCASFVEAISRYAGGAQAALYLRDEAGSYRLETGELAGAAPSCADDPAIAAMRAERQPVELDQVEGHLPGALALPMLDQGALIGFALLEHRHNAAHYRPDEVRNLGWAAQQIGLDLQALQARNLKARVAELDTRLASLTERNATLTRDRDRFMDLLAGGKPVPGEG